MADLSNPTGGSSLGNPASATFDITVPVGSPVDNGDGTESVSVSLTAPLTTEGRQFVRLRVGTD